MVLRAPFRFARASRVTIRPTRMAPLTKVVPGRWLTLEDLRRHRVLRMLEHANRECAEVMWLGSLEEEEWIG